MQDLWGKVRIPEPVVRRDVNSNPVQIGSLINVEGNIDSSNVKQMETIANKAVDKLVNRLYVRLLGTGFQRNLIYQTISVIPTIFVSFLRILTGLKGYKWMKLITQVADEDLWYKARINNVSYKRIGGISL